MGFFLSPLDPLCAISFYKFPLQRRTLKDQEDKTGCIKRKETECSLQGFGTRKEKWEVTDNEYRASLGLMKTV